MTTTTTHGGSFLLDAVGAADHFIPEEFSSEQRQFGDTTREFLDRDVSPRDAEIEAAAPGAMAGLLKKAGELGLLMVEVPEIYGGLGLGKVTAVAVAENAARQGSFIVALICHTGIGTLPVLYYGNEAQKKKYLPKLATGEMIGAYSLTEAGSGSDALAAKARATKSADGNHYLLNGEKLFVTNGGFADLFTVFAKVDGQHFTAFLVERNTEGLSIGPEEHKMGIHGSSTVPLIMQDAKIPVENVLGEVGKGHRIAFNTLNVGRYKLGAASMGGCKTLLAIGVKYVQERQQFGKALAEFGSIQQKIADIAIRTFCIESISYRYAGDMDRETAGADLGDAAVYLRMAGHIKDMAIEASIAKVYGSEILGYAADEVLQMHGGYGFLTDYKPARYYNDNRINRIFEGTNEINRLLIAGTLFKRIGEGTLDFLGAFQRVLEELRNGFPTVAADAPLAVWQAQVEQLKKMVLYVGGVAINTFGPDVEERQQILTDLANLLIETYAIDSAMARVLKLYRMQPDADAVAVPAQMVQTYMAERLPQLKALARQTLVNIGEGNAQVCAPYLKAVERFLPFVPFDTATAKRQIAATMLQHGGYGW